MKYTELQEKLQLLKGKKISQSKIGEVIGTTRQNIGSKFNNPKSEVSVSELQKVESFYNVSLYRSPVRENDTVSISVDYYPDVFGSCGKGQFVLSEQKELIQVPQKFFNHFSTQKHYSVINAIGESMLPTLRPKDKLIVEHWQGEQIKDNQVYVFCYKDEIFVKRLIKNIDEIIVKSDNPDPMYRPRYIEKEDMNNILIVGEIVGLMRDMR